MKLQNYSWNPISKNIFFFFLQKSGYLEAGIMSLKTEVRLSSNKPANCQSFNLRLVCLFVYIVLLNWLLGLSMSYIAIYLFLCELYLVFVVCFPCVLFACFAVTCMMCLLLLCVGKRTQWKEMYWDILNQMKRWIFTVEGFWLQWRILYGGSNLHAQLSVSLSVTWNIIAAGVKPCKHPDFSMMKLGFCASSDSYIIWIL